MRPLNTWHLTKIEGTLSKSFTGCWIISMTVDDEEMGYLHGEAHRYQGRYLCQDGRIRGSCISGLSPTNNGWEREAVLASKECGYFDSKEEAEALLKRKGYEYLEGEKGE
jgi:hypothetical protein